MDAITDTDILSAFGKANKVGILNRLFPKIFIAPAVFEELLEVQRIRILLREGCSDIS